MLPALPFVFAIPGLSLEPLVAGDHHRYAALAGAGWCAGVRHGNVALVDIVDKDLDRAIITAGCPEDQWRRVLLLSAEFFKGEQSGYYGEKGKEEEKLDLFHIHVF